MRIPDNKSFICTLLSDSGAIPGSGQLHDLSRVDQRVEAVAEASVRRADARFAVHLSAYTNPLCCTLPLHEVIHQIHSVALHTKGVAIDSGGLALVW